MKQEDWEALGVGVFCAIAASTILGTAYIAAHFIIKFW